jgi:hypothetical protein
MNGYTEVTPSLNDNTIRLKKRHRIPNMDIPIQSRYAHTRITIYC